MRKQYLVQIVWGAVLVVGLACFSSQAWADDTAQLKEQLKALQERVNQLESQLADKEQFIQPPVMPPVDMPAYDQWEDPFTQMMLMRERMKRNMHQAFANTEAFTLKMDMKQTDRDYIITMDIPGVEKDKINVEVKSKMLIISGERHNETKDNKNNQYYRQERSFGSFMQAVPLPEDARRDQIEAGYKNGVLTVTVGRMKKGENKFENKKIIVK